MVSTLPRMTFADKLWHARWRVASGHKSGRWRVVRRFYPPLEPAPGLPAFQEAEGKSGRTLLFRYRANAQKLADRLNAGLDG